MVDLDVKYDPGDQVLVSHVTGGPLVKPLVATILKPLERSRIYAYVVRSGIHDINVREDWLAPAEVIIQEVPDTPWD